MKKLTAALTAIAVVSLVGVSYLHSRNNDLPKIVETGTYIPTSEVEIDGHTIGLIYEHCKKCSAGVYLDHKQEGIRCTYCGEKKKTGG